MLSKIKISLEIIGRRRNLKNGHRSDVMMSGDW
jgi:hypothetical protein